MASGSTSGGFFSSGCVQNSVVVVCQQPAKQQDHYSPTGTLRPSQLSSQQQPDSNKQH